MPLTLLVEDGTDDRPRTLGGAVITLGRVPGNDVVVQDARVSSRHGRLVRRGEGYAYEDLGSRNGSLVERAGEQTVAAPHEPRAVRAGDRLLLGDLVSPVVVRILDAPATGGDAWAGGTVIARRSVADVPALEQEARPETLRALFVLLRDLSGQTDPDRVMERIADAIFERFPHACAVTVMMRDPQEQWVAECARTRGRGEAEAVPSSTLLQRAVESREVVAYIPGAETGPESVAGLAGSVLVPLLAGEEAIGVLHVDSRSRPFGGEDLAWLTIAATHLAAALVSARRFRTLSRATDALRAENDALRNAAAMPRPIVGRSPALNRALRQLERVGRTQTTVLVLGETGTGKELAARYIHAHSRRAEQVFAPINCGALPEELLNSELFGHRKGAFTGADRDRKGLFEAADGGTVFLDEIGEVTPAVQVRLLRVLQEREVQPVGARAPIKVDVRIIAATNRDLRAEVDAGRFREDLYYRLAVFPVELPPLREREGDVELLAEKFRESACARHDAWVNGFTDEAMRALVRYAWPGNVRQLEHEIERAVILASPGGLIGREELSAHVAGERSQPRETSQSSDDSLGALPSGELKDVMAILEERFIRRCLAEHGGNRTRAAEALGISRQALQAKLARWRERDD
ncbi:MAG: sigma 54-interacting transcriptional regulator [Myxococcales bacterium]|nr:sigma 54-interacting transcriptional regulator [Myxococcales bacterium]MCB9552047.1 sigma 54-interacting transcriptional regulator [Myxococcales bacterium]